jgi:hypothetical protein
MNGLMEGKLISAKRLQLMKFITDGIGYGIGQFSMYDRSIYGHREGIDGLLLLINGMELTFSKKQ